MVLASGVAAGELWARKQQQTICHERRHKHHGQKFHPQRGLPDVRCQMLSTSRAGSPPANERCAQPAEHRPAELRRRRVDRQMAPAIPGSPRELKQPQQAQSSDHGRKSCLGCRRCVRCWRVAKPPRHCAPGKALESGRAMRTSMVSAKFGMRQGCSVHPRKGDNPIFVRHSLLKTRMGPRQPRPRARGPSLWLRPCPRRCCCRSRPCRRCHRLGLRCCHCQTQAAQLM
mmetsp:Transcript_33765/g.96865  ORF Transcript_33765/g.96865 Transcript_33765/m.96865 type:complete len:229 (+) Transcript_33765:300-986(+)